ncbi:MAG: hypothetical protein NC203_11485, partial [Firmicutes bacterium]|nr:hypothetical protein [[Eubacterium] siraeum]MCM1488977.1 hypothetical protein [Bacillota bacterium]
MKMRKLVAALSAAALAVSSLSVAAFADSATADTGYASCSAAESKIISGATKGSGSSEQVKEVTSEIAADGTTLKINVKVEKPKKDGGNNDDGTQPAIPVLLQLSYTDSAAKNHVIVNGYTPEAESVLGETINLWGEANRAFADTTSDATANVKHYWLYQFTDTVGVAVKGDVTANKWTIRGTETSSGWKDNATNKQLIEVTYEEVEAAPAVPDGYTELPSDWSASVTLDGKTAKAGDKVVVEFANIKADAKLSIKSKQTDWPALPGFNDVDGVAGGCLNIADGTVKHEYTLTAADITAINEPTGDDKGAIVVGGCNLCVKASIVAGTATPPVSLLTAELSGNGWDSDGDKTTDTWNYQGSIPVKASISKADLAKYNDFSVTLTIDSAKDGSDADVALSDLQFTAQVLGDNWVNPDYDNAGTVSGSTVTVPFKKSYFSAADAGDTASFVVCVSTKEASKVEIPSSAKITIKYTISGIPADPTGEGDSTTAAGGAVNPIGPGVAEEPTIRPVAPTTEAAATTAAPEVVTAAGGEAVEAPANVIPAGAVLEVKEQTKEEAVAAVEAVKATEENKEVVETIKEAVEAGTAVVVDIDLVKDGAKVQPNGTIKVTINVPEALKSAAKIYVYRVEADGTFTDVKATVEGGKIVF